MTKNLKVTVLALFIFQVLISMGFELAHDEAYYWIYSNHLDWGYFDHPPFVGVVIRIFSFLPHSEFAVRFGFILLQFASLLILLRLTNFSFRTLILFFAFPLASITGLLALPDVPLLFMTSVYCLILKRYLEKDDARISAALGISIALLFYAKYHGVLLVFFTILALPKLLLRKSFYLVASIAFLAFFPHLLWQYHHGFSTIRYHFFERPQSSFSLVRSLEFIFLQTGLAGIFVGPIIWYSVYKIRAKDSFERILKFISIGTVCFFLFSSLSKKVEANWTIFLAVPLILLVSPRSLWEKKWPQRLAITSFIIVVVARILFVVPAQFISIKRLREFHGWKLWAHQVKNSCAEAPLIANSYQVASKLSFYLNSEVSALNYNSRKNQFDIWRFDQRIPSEKVCYITDKTEFSGEMTVSPDGKILRIAKNESIEKLWGLKYNQR
jgi:4-amino-4-deoxy-L-arabinose transferase-like glycosyltransferase